MFSYLDGFVTICSQVDAMEIVNLVNNMFISFDKLTELHDVYKVMRNRFLSADVSLHVVVHDCNQLVTDLVNFSHFEVQYQQSQHSLWHCNQLFLNGYLSLY